MVKIAFFDVKDSEVKNIKKSLGKYKLKLFKEELDNKNINQIKDYDIVSVFIYSKINKKKLLKNFQI